MVHLSVTPGKGEYSIFESVNGDADVRAMLVPVPTKNFAGVYIFKSGKFTTKLFSWDFAVAYVVQEGVQCNTL